MSTKKTKNDSGADAMPKVEVLDMVGDIGGGPALVATLRDCVTHLTTRAWECGEKAYKLAERNQWPAVLDMVMAGNKAERDAAAYLKTARELAERAAKQRSVLLKKTHGAKAAKPGAEAMRRMNAAVAECARLAEDAKRAAEPCGTLPVLEGMARMRLRRPMNHKAVDAMPAPQKRASGRPGPTATARDHIPRLRARTVVEIETGKGWLCISDERANEMIRSGKCRRATEAEVAESAEWMVIEKTPLRLPKFGSWVFPEEASHQPDKRAKRHPGANAGDGRVSRELRFLPATWAELQTIADAEKKGDVGEVLSRAIREECRTFRNRVRTRYHMSAKTAKKAEEALAQIDAGKAVPA